jgi:hypothetical protein
VYAPPSNPVELSELYGRYFLNVAYGDFDLAREAGLSAADLVVAAGSPARGLSVHPPILEQGATFLSYCKMRPLPALNDGEQPGRLCLTNDAQTSGSSRPWCRRCR